MHSWHPIYCLVREAPRAAATLAWSRRMTLLETLEISLPIIQAPMAGVSSPAMAAAVSDAGALGSLGVGATDAEGAPSM
jgi:nitronate monooxygenase